MCINKIFDINSKELEQINYKYSLLEPLLFNEGDETKQKELRQKACLDLGVSPRTLRRYIHKFKKEKSITVFKRKRRKDNGVFRKFSELLVPEAIRLLKENPYRSIKFIWSLMCESEDANIVSSAKNISPSTLYHYLIKSDFDFTKNRREVSDRQFHRFEATHAHALWQGDARHGIFLPDPQNPKKKKRTYMFAWLDDFSRKVIFAKYYFDEQVPRLEDCFRQAILKWGKPEKVYLDNGSAYISKHFSLVVDALSIRKIHHPPYQAWCKGKIEMMMKRFKVFQRESAVAGFKTIEELNQHLNAWVDLEYNNKIHSATGQTPDDRFNQGVIDKPPVRITDIEKFNEAFFWQDERVVTKYGEIHFNSNKYKVNSVAPRQKVTIQFDPLDLSIVYIFYKDKFLHSSKANDLQRTKIKNIPEERDEPKNIISKSARNYFSKLQDQHLKKNAINAKQIKVTNI